MVKAQRQARAPGRCVLELGCTGHAGRMAGCTLAVVDRFAAAQGAVGVTDLDLAHLLQADGLGHFQVGCAWTGLVF
ncbi:hypothetical protein D3C80_1551620 [compost metagenome]